MDYDIKIVRGPSSTNLKKEAAATELEKLPNFPKDATYEIDEVDGRWVAAVLIPKTAEFPPPSGEEEAGPPAPSADEEAGPPEEKSESKSDDESSSEGAPKADGKGDGKMSVEHQLANLTDMLTKITDALGLSSPADGMIPGADDGMVPPPGGPEGPGPTGTGGDPSMGHKPGVGSDNKMHTVHERSLKPGEAPPGTTPVGAPSFASVQVEEAHPWKDAIEAGVKEFEVESPIGEERLAAVAAELKGLAEPYGYTVTDLAPSGAGSTRIASARIVRTR